MAGGRAGDLQAHAVLAIAVLAGFACGDDDHHGVGTGHMDGGLDGAVDAGPDAGKPPPPHETPPMFDAGREDSGGPHTAFDAGPPPVDEDAGVVTCKTLRCSAMNDGCNTFTCDAEKLVCVKGARPNGTECGSQVLDNCTAPDRCMAGVCQPRDSAKGTPCGDQDVVCHQDDACDGKGKCKDAGFVDEDTPCSTGTPELSATCDAPDSCDAAGVCQDNAAPSSTTCGDHDVKCRYDDHCDGFGLCLDGGLWELGSCPEGEASGSCACGRTDTGQCHPAADVCVAGICDLGALPDGTSCSTGTPETSATCDSADTCKTGNCSDNAALPSTLCSTGTPESNPTCDLSDHCDGSGGCSDNPAGTEVVCGVAPDACHDARRCDGGGACASAMQLPAGTSCGLPQVCMLAPTCNAGGACGIAMPADAGTACGSPASSVCDASDLCDGAGSCDEHHVEPGVACGPPGAAECDLQDVCDGNGACDPNYVPQGSACGDQGVACLDDDGCDGSGHCTDEGMTHPCSAELHGFVYAYGNPAVGIDVEVLGQVPAAIATTDSLDRFTLEVPVWDEILWYVEPSPGVFWGSVKRDVLTSASLTYYGLLVDPDTAVAQWSSVGGLVVDAAKGIVAVTFSGALGGETVGLGAAHAAPVAEVSDGVFAFSNALPVAHPTLYFFNVTTGTTTVSITSSPPGSTCTVDGSVVNWPVRARSVTRVDVSCE